MWHNIDYSAMTIYNHKYTLHLVSIILLVCLSMGVSLQALGASATNKDFTVVIDAGHGGKDHGAIDNGVREKDINLSVALRLGELIKKKLKNTKVVFTRDDDTFVSLQGRADIANKAKGDLFISIHTNSVDAKNKNRKTVAGASVYTQGGHKDEANMAVARRENSVIELENGYQQKYSGFDPNKVESYIIFEMAAKHNISQSHRFAKNVQDNLVKIASRKDRGVHQAGFWVLWATSMPSALIELDFICNPESAKYMTSKEGVDKLAEAIFEAVKVYEQNFMQKQKMMSDNNRNASRSSNFASAVHAGVNTSHKVIDYDYNPSANYTSDYSYSSEENYESSGAPQPDMVAISRIPEQDNKDLSHSNLRMTASQVKPRHAADGRRRRSVAAKSLSDSRNLSVNHIKVNEEFTGEMAKAEPLEKEPKSQPVMASSTPDKNKKKKGKDNTGRGKENVTKGKNSAKGRDWVAQVNKNAQNSAKEKRVVTASSDAKASSEAKHAGERKSLKRR